MSQVYMIVIRSYMNSQNTTVYVAIRLFPSIFFTLGKCHSHYFDFIISNKVNKLYINSVAELGFWVRVGTAPFTNLSVFFKQKTISLEDRENHKISRYLTLKFFAPSCRSLFNNEYERQRQINI
jgi:hypothetical protein